MGTMITRIPPGFHKTHFLFFLAALTVKRQNKDKHSNSLLFITHLTNELELGCFRELLCNCNLFEIIIVLIVINLSKHAFYTRS